MATLSLNQQLFEATNQGSLAEIQNLIARGANINARTEQGGSVLQVAALRGYVDVVVFLIAQGAVVDNKDSLFGNSALMAAAINGHHKVAQILIEAGGDVNVRGIYGNNALHFAAIEGHVEVAKLLIEKGANVNAIVADNNSILHGAVMKNNIVISKLLLDNGAKVDTLLNSEGTVLGEATANGLAEMVDLLLSKKANVNIPNANGNTPLIEAILNSSSPFNMSEDCSYAICQKLLKKGADVNVLNLEGLTALDCVNQQLEPNQDLSLLERKQLTKIKDQLVQNGAKTAKEVKFPDSTRKQGVSHKEVSNRFKKIIDHYLLDQQKKQNIRNKRPTLQPVKVNIEFDNSAQKSPPQSLNLRRPPAIKVSKELKAQVSKVQKRIKKLNQNNNPVNNPNIVKKVSPKIVRD